MYTLGVYCPSPADTTSFYRGMGPLSHLAKNARHLDIIVSSTWQWMNISMCDLMFIQRPASKDAYGLIEICRDVGVPVWVDYDDHLLQVPTDNPAFFQFSDEAAQESVVRSLRNADVISVSTEHLARQFRKVAPNAFIVVIPNAFNEVHFNYRQVRERQKRVIWRGSRTHHRDVMTQAESIIDLSNMEKFKDWLWHFIGDNLWFLTDRMPHKQTYITKPVDPHEYHRHIHDLCPTALIAPLYPSDFNYCKSNIAFIEATFAGAVTIAPRWEEWDLPGVLTYDNSQKDFSYKLKQVLEGKVDTGKMVAEAWTFINDALTLSKMNQRRVNLICSILGVEPKELGYKERITERHGIREVVPPDASEDSRKAGRDMAGGGAAPHQSL